MDLHVHGLDRQPVLLLDLVPVPLGDDFEGAEWDDPQVWGEVVDVAALETLLVLIQHNSISSFVEQMPPRPNVLKKYSLLHTEKARVATTVPWSESMSMSKNRSTSAAEP
jgi:hypothetical protein